MVQNVALVFIYSFELLIEYIFFSKISKQKENIGLRLLLSLAVFEFAVVLNALFSNSILINAVYFFAANLIASFLCFSLPLLQRLFYVVLLYIFSVLPEFGTIFFISCIFKVEANAYNSDPALLIMMGCISKTVYFIISLILLRFVERDKTDYHFPLTLYLYPFSTVFSIILLWILTIKYVFPYNVRIAFVVASLALLGGTVVLFVTYQQSLRKEKEYIEVKSELLRTKTEKAYYDILELQNQQLMIYAHDAKNHLTAIKDLNTDPEIDSYISKMVSNLSDYSNVCHSGNMMLDVIMNRYKTESKIKNISFSFDVKTSNLSFVDNFDLVTILNNLLDNAFEAAASSEKKVVSIETDRRNSYDVVIITNSCDTEPVTKENRLLTTKSDSKSHGFGLKSVSGALKKYSGDINWEYFESRHEFVATVAMKKPIPRNN